MKNLRIVSCTACFLSALAGCGTDPILIGELVQAGQQSTTPTADDEPPAVDPPTDEPPTSESPPSSDEGDDRQAQVEALLLQYCGACHDGPDASADFGYIGDVDEMILKGLLIPGDAEDSRIYARIVDESMPPPSVHAPRPTPDELAFIGQFIDDLAP